MPSQRDWQPAVPGHLHPEPGFSCPPFCFKLARFQSMTHTVEMKFNGQEVPGSPWKIPIEDKTERRRDMSKTQSFYSELCGAGLVRAPINRVATFEISGDGLEFPDIKAQIYGPDGKEYPVRIIPRGSGKYTAEYKIEKVISSSFITPPPPVERM